MMRISSVTDYILKLEKLNQESREKIDSLKELFLKSEEEKVKALRELNELKQKPTVSHVTLIPDETCPMNEEIANHLMLISLKESDVYKARAYKNAAEIIAKLTYEVTDGISCAKRTKGIGPSIAAKIDEFLDNYYNSEDDSDYDSDAESVASNDTGSAAFAATSRSASAMQSGLIAVEVFAVLVRGALRHGSGAGNSKRRGGYPGADGMTTSRPHGALLGLASSLTPVPY